MNEERQMRCTAANAVGGYPTDRLPLAGIIASTVKGIGRYGGTLEVESPPDSFAVTKHKLVQGMLAVEDAWYRAVSGSQEVRPPAGPGLLRVPKERPA
jgi:hypothetical protein